MADLSQTWSRKDKLNFAEFYKENFFNRQIFSSFAHAVKKTTDDVRLFASATGITALSGVKALDARWDRNRCMKLAKYLGICMGSSSDIAWRMNLKKQEVMKFALSPFGCKFIKNELARMRLLMSMRS